MLKRRTSGSVVCPSCGSLVGVRDDKCYTCGRSNPGLWGFGPALRQFGTEFAFGPVVVGTCVTVWVASLLLSGGAIGRGGLFSMLSPSRDALFLLGASGSPVVFGLGRWWTVLTAGWLHAGLLHIAMNMYWVWQMGPAITDLFGTSRTVIIYVVGGIAGFLLSSVAGAYFPSLPFLAAGGLTVGASAPVFGLIGAMYHYGKMGSSSIRQIATSIMIQAVIFGLLVPGIDNYAHLGGFAGGYFTSAFLNPMTRERGDHTIVAAVLLAATAGAFLASILTGLQFLR
jgi:rhomboid protease GluP